MFSVNINGLDTLLRQQQRSNTTNKHVIKKDDTYDTILSHKLSKIYAYVIARDNIYPSYMLVAIKHMHNIDNDNAIKILNDMLNMTNDNMHDIMNITRDAIFMIGNKQLFINLMNIDRIEQINDDIKELPKEQSNICQIIIRHEIDEFNKILYDHRSIMHGLIKQQEYNKLLEEKKKRARLIGGSLEVIDNICPITQEEIIEPAMLQCGHMFEKSEITKYRNESTKNKCPCCRKPIVFIE